MSHTCVQSSTKKRTLLCTFVLILLTFSLAACNGDSVKEFQAEGRKLMEEGNPNGAIVFFRNALDEDSKNFDLRFDLAKAYLKAGKIPQAEAELEKCLLQQPANVDLLLTVAEFNTSARKPEKALKYISDVESAQKPTADTRELAAVNYRAINNLVEAEKAYKEAIALDAKKTSSQLGLAQLYLAQVRTQEASDVLNKMLIDNPNDTSALRLKAHISMQEKDFTTAEETFKKLKQLVPTDASPSYSLGSLMLSQGKTTEAEALLSDMNKNFKTSAHADMLAGMIAFQKNDFELASTFFQQAINKAPSIEGFYRLALSLRQLNNLESALSNLRRILDVRPSHASALTLTAQILLQQKRFVEAELEAKRLVETNPQNAAGFNLLGEVQKALGKNEEALLSFEKALEINPKLSQATMSRTNILLAQNHELEAIAELEKGLQANKNSISARVALYNYYMNKKDFEKATQTIDEGLKDQPEHSLLLTMKAGVQMALKENEAAVASLQKAYAAQPTFLPAIQLLLNIYMVQNDYQAALELCDAYLAHSPENESFLVTSAVILDNLKKTDEATARLEKANALNSERALTSLVRRALVAKDVAKAEKYLTDKLATSPTPQLRTTLAGFYVNQNSMDKALAIYNAEELKNSPEGLVGKFRLYVTAKKYTEAIAEAEALIKANEQAPIGYIFKALALEQNKNFDEAFKTLEDAYKKNQTPQLLLQLGNICMRNKQYEKALSYFHTVLLTEPNNIEALMGQGFALIQQNDATKAITSYEKALTLAPENVIVLNNLATALAEHGENTARAVELATKAYVGAPENQDVIDTYAFALIANKQISEALNVVNNGLKAHPESGMLYYRLGMAHLAENKKSLAIEALKKAVELNNFTDIEKAKQLLDKNK